MYILKHRSCDFLLDDPWPKSSGLINEEQCPPSQSFVCSAR